MACGWLGWGQLDKSVVGCVTDFFCVCPGHTHWSMITHFPQDGMWDVRWRLPLRLSLLKTAKFSQTQTANIGSPSPHAPKYHIRSFGADLNQYHSPFFYDWFSQKPPYMFFGGGWTVQTIRPGTILSTRPAGEDTGLLVAGQSNPGVHLIAVVSALDKAVKQLYQHIIISIFILVCSISQHKFPRFAGYFKINTICNHSLDFS